MKIVTSNQFDTSAVAQTKSFQDLQGFFDHYNVLTDDVVKTLRSALSVSDNLRSQVLSLTVEHGKPQSIALSFKTSCLFLDGNGTLVKSMRLTQSTNGRYNFVVYFDEPIARAAYGAQWVSGSVIKITLPTGHGLRTGDAITLNDFLRPVNNGTFPVVRSEADYVQVLNAGRTSNTDDEIYTSLKGFDSPAATVILTLLG